MILDRFRVTGRVAVVTGAGRGIGAATAVAPAQAGADVVISARTGDQLAAVAREDLALRIRVNAVAVGAVATSALDIVLTDDTLRAQMERATPLGRIGDPGDVAAAVLFLASPAAGYITGKVIEVDGGIERPNLDLPIPDL